MELGLCCFSYWYHYGLSYSRPKAIYVEALPPVLQNVTAFDNESVFMEVIKAI